ncbi:MAG: hypothetical protein AB8G05_10440 [Oligoflexales bacterium]
MVSFFRMFNFSVSILFIFLHIGTKDFSIAGPIEKGHLTNGDDGSQIRRHYGYLYWENGSPQKNISRRPKSWVNPEMAKNPDIVFQTGYYNVRFETDTLQLSGYESSPGSDYLAALTEDVSFLPDHEAKLSLTVKVDQGDEVVEYSASSGIVESATNLNVRLIENGRFVQRIDHTGLVFENSQGDILPESGFFEITSWPKQMVLTFDFSKTSLPVVGLGIKLLTPGGKTHLVTENKNKISLVIEPATDSALGIPDFFVSQAYEQSTKIPLDVEFDSGYHAFRLDIPSHDDGDHDKLDEFVFEINNSGSKPQDIPIVFNQLGGFDRISGMVMSLVELDGSPSGIPIQISKNWHKKYPVKHAGTWLRGSTVISVDGNSKRKLILRLIRGYWDQAATASHAQLSLIGWNKYSWKWDESALGAWGESMTFDPGQTIAGAFIADIRPTFTSPTNGSADHGWTENVGGGDFLKYFDQKGKYRWAKKLKTAYHWTGPNMTEVLYSGISDNDSIKFVYKTQLVRCNDYHRRFNHFRYEFLKNVSPRRLVFYQMASDYYLLPQFVSAHWGNEADSYILSPYHGGNLYTQKFPFKNQWISINDLISGKNNANSNRGIIWRNSQMNGLDYKLYAHVYGRAWGRDTSLFDISGQSTSQEYYAGNVIEGEIEYIMPAKSNNYYWGNDTHFSRRLSQSSKAWMLTQQEFIYNDFKASVSGGKILNHYPVEIESKGEKLDIQIVIPASKGIGHIPIILRDVDANKIIYAHIIADEGWVPAAEDYSNYGKHAYYQAYLNANGMKDYAFNIARPDFYSFNKPLIIRISEEKLYNQP